MTRTRRRLIYAVLLAIAFTALVAAFLIHPDPSAPVRDKAIVAVSPDVGNTEPRQTTVFAELASDYEGALSINNREIPDDQVDRLQTGNNRLAFTPGPDKEFSALPAGRTCARVDFWPAGQTREAASRSYVWCFTLH
jgi:hypothetical protein